MNNIVLIGKLKQNKGEGFTLKDMNFDPNGMVKKKPVSQVVDVAEKDTTVYEYDDLDNWAMFPDGDVQGALKYVRDRVHYPDNVSADIKGLVQVSFIVNADGTLTDVQLRKGLNPALDEQVIQAFKSMPKWTPAKKDGKSVRSKYAMAVGVEKQ